MVSPKILAKEGECCVDFFLGIRLPRDFEETCERYRRAFKAPKTVTHITLVPPFSWDEPKEKLKELLDSTLGKTPSFRVAGSGLGSFGTRVLFVNVDLTPELLALHEGATEALRQAGVVVDTRPYNPHITLATRLDAKTFAKYKAELGDFSPEYSFTCSHLSLFHFTPEKRWHEWYRVVLK